MIEVAEEMRCRGGLGGDCCCPCLVHSVDRGNARTLLPSRRVLNWTTMPVKNHTRKRQVLDGPFGGIIVAITLILEARS